MQHLRPIWALFLAFAVMAFSAPADAQNTISWVSGTGSGTACTRAAPCGNFGTALGSTLVNGEVRCVDAGGDFGASQIRRSVTIDCREAPAVVISIGLCFDINLTTSLASDPAQTATIRGVTCDGLGTVGVLIVNAAAVYLEDMVIIDNATQGVLDRRTHDGVLFIKNSLIKDNAGAGIVAATTGGPYGASIDNVHSVRNAFGIAVASGNNVMVTRSTLSGNSIAGLELDPGAQITLDNSIVNFNPTGVLSSGFLTLMGSTISYNNTAISGASNSFGDNKI